MNPYRILVVEDDDAIREALVSVLELEGYQVMIAEDGQVALEILKNGKFDPHVILLDLNMPRVSGREFLKIRQDQRICPGARIAIFAATKDIEDLPGVSTWIRKPADLDVILREISVLLLDTSK